jgi:hypothetical protein
MVRRYLLTCLVLAIALVGTSVFAQGTQVATIVGNVTGPDGTPLPGVTVSATAVTQMGERSTVTNENGDYILRGLAPGNYTVRFTLAGLQTAVSQVNVPLAGTSRADAQMRLSVAEETIVVTAEAPSVLETSTVGANIPAETVRQLPVVRTPVGIASLSGSVTDRTPVAGQLSISGGMAYDNSILVNGVNVQDPIFGTTNNLFIEDAILETQVQTSGISAEYGHFTGGVLNVVTRSGGNTFQGSVRADFNRPEWRDETPFERGFRGDGVPPGPSVPRKGDLGKVYMGTLGGPILRDRLWFFGALRDQEDTSTPSLAVTGQLVPRTITNQRYEIKLTGNITSNHTLQASYVENPVDATHEIQVGPLEMAAIGLNSSRINDGTILSYNGVLSNSLFAEARWSEKMFGFRGLGGTSTSIVDSPMRSATRHGGGVGTFNAPYFDATDPEDRNNEAIFGALSYFLATRGLGSHDIKLGGERFTVTRTGGNSQSSSDYVFYTGYALAGAGVTPLLDSSGRMIPVFRPRSGPGGATLDTRIGWWVSERGAELDITTDSIFINDRWDLNSNWTFNLGVRHEIVKSEATGNIVAVDTTTTTPRLGASFDPLGDGRFKIDATYAQYAGRYNPAIIGRNSPVGSPSLLYGYYVGPEGSGRNFAPGFDTSNYVFYYARVGTRNQFFEKGLKAPIQHEWTLSGGTALPRGGWFKASYINRELKGVIDDFVDNPTTCTQIVFQGINAGCFDNVYYRNTNLPQREYQAIQLQSRYNILRNWQVEGNYTHQIRNHGNYEGEGGQSIGATPIGDRPEIQSPREFPTGRLSQYQAHKVRLWTTYNLGFGRFGNLSSGLIYRYDSGLTYSYTTSVARPAVMRARNPGYQTSGTTVGLFFGERGAGEFNDTHNVDVSFNYGIPVFGRVEPWVKVDIRNVLNDQTLTTHNITVSADPNSPLDADGLRTGFVRGAAFGRPVGAGSYNIPREYLVSAGIRF